MRISLRVIPNSKSEGLQKLGARSYRIKVREKAFEGRANAAVVELLSHHFKVKRSEVSIIKGLAARDKIIEIKGLEDEV
ncbi:MAG: DUF167 domain-containing protein [Candidatus Micrarchaeota archaeon]|nr:DUF167 domain-containing protein [Candidatus Micrarchaeota archaeon]